MHGIEVDDLDAVLGADAHLLGRQASFPVPALHVVLRLQLAQDRFGVELVDVRVADEADGVDDHRALVLRQQRRMLRADVAIGGDVAQQRHVELLGRGAKILDVPAVQRIERAVHHRHLLPVAPSMLDRTIKRIPWAHDFTRSPLSCSSWSALSKKSTATSGVVFAHSISSEKPCSSDTFGRKAERLARARDVGGVVADVELAAGLRDLRLDRAAEQTREQLRDLENRDRLARSRR